MPLYPIYFNRRNMEQVDVYQDHYNVPVIEAIGLFKQMGLICLEYKLTPEKLLELLNQCATK